MISDFISSAPSPSYVIDLDSLSENARLIAEVRERSGAKVLLALKGYAAFGTFDLLRAAIDGTCASGPYEARLGAEEFGPEVHAYATAFSESSLAETLAHASTITFNSVAQLERFAPIVASNEREVSIGLRVNPESSSSPVPIYDPCGKGSRFGVRAADLPPPGRLGAVDGLMLHTLCEADSSALAASIEAFERKFTPLPPSIRWGNFGGGHFLNKPDYDVDALIAAIRAFRDQFKVDVILEPGGGLVVDTGELHASVIDVHWNDGDIALLDASASTHMPDVLEVPYRPEVSGAAASGELAHTYRLAGRTCMTGDIIGDYSFDKPLQPGDRVIFEDQMHYSFVKTNTFNGNPLANLAIRHEDGRIEPVSDFGYDAFRSRLGR